MTADRRGGAAALRRVFDDTFRAPPPEPRPTVALLVLGVGTARYAVRRSQVASVGKLPPLRSVPSSVPELGGIVAVGAELLAVYPLDRLLGRPPAEARWLLRPSEAPEVAIAFSALEGQLDVEPDRLAPAAGEAHVEGIVSDTDLCVLRLPAIVQTIRDRCGVEGSSQ